MVGHDVDSYREFEPETDRAREEGQQAPEAPLPPDRHGQKKKTVNNQRELFRRNQSFRARKKLEYLTRCNIYMTHSVRKQNNQIEAFPSVTHAALRWADRRRGKTRGLGRGQVPRLGLSQHPWTGLQSKQASPSIHGPQTTAAYCSIHHTNPPKSLDR